MFAAILKLPIRTGFVRFSDKKPSSLPIRANGRSKRRLHRQELVQDVCPSISDWVPRTEAYDPYGNKLTVVQRIPINGTIINQYFYETFCANNYPYNIFDYDDDDDFIRSRSNKKPEEMQCKGVDKTK
ncbi:uncharacterized protein B4U80_05804 [Leptotrombidium deliense]|uniref:Nerve growth factor-related domain-containing protein n=1 Tax=Leptotrombidium deliense TaxID=299467 RepID=A0A443SDH3_9ACAR|nr:uncharacterized protein B4U80_05804 [Leptotrombidium deliense]